MNWKWLILALMTLYYGYKMLLHWVRNRSANNPTPENTADVYDAETYLRWKHYSAEKGRLGVISTAVSFLVTTVLLCTNAYAAFAELFPEGIFWQLLAVLLLETMVDTVTDTVLRYVEIMKIEEKYGFNRSNMKTFLADRLRSMIVALLLGVGVMWLFADMHRSMGDRLILRFAGILFLGSLLTAFLYPVFSRIGNKFVPLEDGELRERLMALLAKNGYRVKDIKVMDASRRTTKLNAYFTGFGKLKTIVLFDNLVNSMSTEEICAVFAHELGHGLHKDILKRQILNFGNLLVMSLVVWLAVREPELHRAFGFDQVNYGFAYILMGIGIGLVLPLMRIPMNAYSRMAEYRADRQAVQEGYGPQLVQSLKKLARENFIHLAPAKLLVVLEYSHPPLSQRIEAIEKAMKESSVEDHP